MIDLYNDETLFSFFALIIDDKKFDLIIWNKYVVDQL